MLKSSVIVVICFINYLTYYFIILRDYHKLTMLP